MNTEDISWLLSSQCKLTSKIPWKQTRKLYELLIAYWKLTASSQTERMALSINNWITLKITEKKQDLTNELQFLKTN